MRNINKKPNRASDVWWGGREREWASEWVKTKVKFTSAIISRLTAAFILWIMIPPGYQWLVFFDAFVNILAREDSHHRDCCLLRDFICF